MGLLERGVLWPITARLLAMGMAIAVGAACQRPGSSEELQGMEALLGARAATPAPSSDGRCELDLEGAAGDTVFFVLGMLAEYNGRQIVEDSDIIEAFFGNEPRAAAVFGEALQQLERQQRLDAGIRIEEDESGLRYYHSKVLADRLNSCYAFRTSARTLHQVADGTYRRTARTSLNRNLFLVSRDGTSSGLHREHALAYVAGAWTRHRRESVFLFFNAESKARLVGELLTFLGCQDVVVDPGDGRLPQGHRVHFQPTEELRARLQ